MLELQGEIDSQKRIISKTVACDTAAKSATSSCDNAAAISRPWGMAHSAASYYTRKNRISKFADATFYRSFG